MELLITSTLPIFCYTILQALASTALSIVLALPLAHFLYRFDFAFKRFFIALLPLLCIMPCKLAALGTMASFNFTGLIGIIAAHCALNIPFALYLLLAHYNRSDSTWEKIARQLGASTWQVYKDIYLPLLKPTIQSASIIIFLLCFSSFSIPLLLGTHEYHMTLDIKISQLYTSNEGWSALLYFLMRLAVVVPLSMTYMHNATAWAPIKHNNQPKCTERYTPGIHGYGWLLYCVAPLVMIIIPFVALMHTMLNENLFHFFAQVINGDNDPFLHIALYIVMRNSIVLACASAIGSVIVGFMAYTFFYATSHTRTKKTVATLATLPFILGNAGCGIITAWLLASPTMPPFVIATVCHIVLNFPFAYRIMTTQRTGWHHEWTLLAQNFGATRWDQLTTLDWPFLRIAMYQAFCISFGLSLTEVGAVSILSGTTGMTMSAAIHTYRQHNFMPGVMGLSLLLLLFVFFASYGCTLYQHRAEQ